MINILLASLLLASPQSAPVKPCVAKTVSGEEAKILIRNLRRQGYRVRVQKPDQPAKIVALGGSANPPALRHANVEVSGCGR